METEDEELKLDKKIEIGLFRIMQESLTNVGRYAKAKKVTVSLLQKNEKVHLSIKDDGEEYDEKEIANKKTLGILGMKERAAMMGDNYINESSPGNGTLVSVSVPINQKSPSVLG